MSFKLDKVKKAEEESREERINFIIENLREDVIGSKRREKLKEVEDALYKPPLIVGSKEEVKDEYGLIEYPMRVIPPYAVKFYGEKYEIIEVDPLVPKIQIYVKGVEEFLGVNFQNKEVGEIRNLLSPLLIEEQAHLAHLTLQDEESLKYPYKFLRFIRERNVNTKHLLELSICHCLSEVVAWEYSERYILKNSPIAVKEKLLEKTSREEAVRKLLKRVPYPFEGIPLLCDSLYEIKNGKGENWLYEAWCKMERESVNNGNILAYYLHKKGFPFSLKSSYHIRRILNGKMSKIVPYYLREMVKCLTGLIIPLR
jgi:hypothetical protein